MAKFHSPSHWPLLLGLGIIIVGRANGEVAYTVYAGSPKCDPGQGRNITTVMDPQAQEIGFCQNHGVGAELYNSIEVLACTDNCLCFKQWAAETAEANCNESMAIGYNVKMTCFDKCLQDCNGINCGDTAEPGSARTRLQLTGSGGPICATPVSDEDFVCETTGMILDANGEIVDEFATDDGDKKEEEEEEEASESPEPATPSPSSSSMDINNRPPVGWSVMAGVMASFCGFF